MVSPVTSRAASISPLFFSIVCLIDLAGVYSKPAACDSGRLMGGNEVKQPIK